MANQFSITPAGANLGQAFAPVAQAYGMKQQEQKQADQLAAQRQIGTNYFAAIDSGDFAAQRAIEASNPMLMQQLNAISSNRESQFGGIESDMANDVIGGMTGEDLATKWEAQLSSFGGQGQQVLEAVRTMGPEQLKDLAIGNLDPEKYKRYRDSIETEGSNLGQVSPKDFTVDSMAAYEQTGDIADLERYRPKTVKIGNIEHAFNNETQKYEPVVDYSDAGLGEQEAAAAENQAASQARLDFGKDKSKFESGRTKYLTNISAAEQKQTVVRNTADKIKDLMGGWSNKYGASLANIPGSQARTLKGLIDTMKANSAFSTLTDLKASGGTLGAISEAELNLLERAWGALDQGGDIVEFERVLDQLVGQNMGSLERARNAFSMDKERYSGSYDDSQRKIQEENTVSWDAL